MGAKVILNEVERLLSRHSDEAMRKQESRRFNHIVEITAFESAGAFVNGTENFINGLDQNDDLVAVLRSNNTKFQYQMVIGEIFSDLISGAVKLKKTKRVAEKTLIKFSDFFVSGAGGTSKQFAILEGSNVNRLIFQVDAERASNTFNIYTICREMRKEIFHRWLRRTNKTLTSEQAAKATRDISNSTDFSHKSRTIGRAGFEQFVKDCMSSDVQPEASFDVNITTVNMLQYIVSRANMKFSVDFNPEFSAGQTTGETRRLKVEGLIQSQGTKRADDWKARKNLGGGVRALIEDGAIEFLRKNVPDLLNTEGRGRGGLATSVEAKGSPSIDENIVSEAVEEITKKATPKKRLKNKKVTIKKQPKVRKRTKRKITAGRKGSAPKALTTKISIKVPAKGRVKRRKEKGKEELNLGPIKTKINRRLGAEIRRNMGRPALINQTGRFSDSAELVSLRQAQNSIIGTYTYQLRPYETFENTGSREWPAGYNPKPLIAKSIRNLAMGTINDKFILRRG